MGPQVAQAAGLGFACRVNAEQHDAEAAEDHRHNGADLEQRQPELHLAKDFDVAQVQAADQEYDAQHPDPTGHFGKPEAHVDAERGDVGEADDDHFKGVGPAEDKPGHGPQVGAGVVAEGARHRVVHGHLTEGAHHHEYSSAADQVGQQHGRTGHLDGGGRAIEQPGADRGTEGHEANMSGVEPAFQTFFWLVHFSSLIILMRRRSFPRSAWELRPGRSASAFRAVTQSVTGCIPTRSVGMIRHRPSRGQRLGSNLAGTSSFRQRLASSSLAALMSGAKKRSLS